MVCKKSKNQVRKFPSLEALQDHYDKAHHLHHCDLCVQEKPVLLFEQELYKWGRLQKHKE